MPTPVAILDPPDIASRPLEYTPIMLYWPCQFSTSCLNCARKGSNSDFKNRMLRPITRKWGICFRSTQRYTVCGLTPKYTAASRTLSGSSSRANDALTRGGVREFGIATSSERRLRQLFEQFAADPIEPIFFHDVELGVYRNRFVEGQLPLPHVPNVGTVQVRGPLRNADRCENFLAVVQEDLHLIECLSVALDFPKVFVNPD